MNYWNLLYYIFRLLPSRVTLISLHCLFVFLSIVNFITTTLAADNNFGIDQFIARPDGTTNDL